MPCVFLVFFFLSLSSWARMLRWANWQIRFQKKMQRRFRSNQVRARLLGCRSAKRTQSEGSARALPRFFPRAEQPALSPRVRKPTGPSVILTTLCPSDVRVSESPSAQGCAQQTLRVGDCADWRGVPEQGRYKVYQSKIDRWNAWRRKLVDKWNGAHVPAMRDNAVQIGWFFEIAPREPEPQRESKATRPTSGYLGVPRAWPK